MRFYLIKFRKQDKHLHKITKAETDFDYSYLNNCATANSSDYIYDITETDPDEALEKLNEKLKIIAENIKSWTGYEEAKNV